ncbi:MAG: hypothetical protein DRH20_09540 [Deltaproteobacteria bacterium]|mgnify:CR=1 FL=1|nr:MAG: hypothetical protein DRH20_09540 [Deltaproteobacteria bacterium]
MRGPPGPFDPRSFKVVTGMDRTLRVADRILLSLEGGLIFLFLPVMVILTFLQVLLRGLYTHAGFQWANALMGHLDWSDPLVRLLVLWVTFAGASLVTRDHRHIKIDLLASILPSRWLPLRDMVLSLVGAVICGLMVKVGFGYVHMEMEFGETLFLNIPAWAGQIILPGGFAMIMCRFLIRSLKQAWALRVKRR